jgi:mono/diheme cytochrome c family protein
MPLASVLRSVPVRSTSLAAAAAAVALLASGCGGGSGDSGSSGGGGNSNAITASTGHEIFQAANCASCHTLAAENATGVIGPNLDKEKPSEALTVEKVTNGDGSMPSFSKRLTPEQIQTVAKYVADSAGK